MEIDEIQCKLPRISYGNGKLGHGQKMDDQLPDEEEDGDNKRGGSAAARGGLLGGGVGRFYGWPSSRIVRVSRASGGKDRHSKVLTSKGLRDRRVRLSVSTAIQFYDLQDRLGYDQPSKAVEWLLKAAAASIEELPPMSNPFPDTPKQLSDEKRSNSAGSDLLRFNAAKADVEASPTGDPSFPQPQITKSSACSSTSETSKGSGGLSLSRSENRIKAREGTKGRVAEKENESSHVTCAVSHISRTTSFTELLTGGINTVSNHTNSSGEGANTNGSNFFLKSPRNWSSTPMDYFTSGLLGPPGQMNPGNPNTFTPVASPLFSVAADHHPELQHFSFVPDMLPVVNVAGGNGSSHHNVGVDYNLNFTISPSSGNSTGALAGFNRGTLQSNSSPPPSLLPQLQRFSDGSPQGFYVENHHHHQFQSGYDARLQLCYGDSPVNDNNGGRHSGQKGKGKN